MSTHLVRYWIVAADSAFSVTGHRHSRSRPLGLRSRGSRITGHVAADRLFRPARRLLGARHRAGTSSRCPSVETAAIVFVVVGFSAMFFGYPIVAELRMQGRTFGTSRPRLAPGHQRGRTDPRPPRRGPQSLSAHRSSIRDRRARRCPDTAHAALRRPRGGHLRDPGTEAAQKPWVQSCFPRPRAERATSACSMSRR